MKKIIFTFLMLTCLALPVGAAGTELKDGFNQQHQGDVRVCARSITLNGQVVGNVYVESNGTFICAGSGRVTGNVYASNGSTVIVKGLIGGNVILDRSSKIRMEGGRVNGRIEDPNK